MVNEQSSKNFKNPDNYILAYKTENYAIPFFKKASTIKTLGHVNIFASGPSIETVNFSQFLLKTPAIFVNGSLSLTKQHDFKEVLAYVITDERFIEHQPELLDRYYVGQPFYTTIHVLETMIKKLPELVRKYHSKFVVIHSADKPYYLRSTNSSWFNNLLPLKPKKLKLSDLANNPNFKIDLEHNPKPIGVSFDIANGFIEAGTVAYVATQLSYSLGAKNIHLYGIDLINSNQPRFYESNNTMAPCKLEKAVENRIIPSFDLLADQYQKQGVTIINHSPVSKDLFKNLSLPK